MIRLLAIAVAALVGIAVLIVISPFLLIGAILILVLAWQRPTAVERVSASQRMTPIPQTLRSTPMRFAATLLAVTLGLTATSYAMAGASAQSPDGGASAGGEWSPSSMAAATPTPTASPTLSPTPSPTPSPTLSPTPSPTPSPTLSPTPVPGEAPTGPTAEGRVVTVVDGDTIDVLVDGIEMRVRLIGIDTPEIHSGVEWLGPEASAAMSSLVAGSTVVLEKDVSETDQYGRALRYVWTRDGSDWTLVNLELLRRGLATITTYPPDVKYVDVLYIEAQDEAQSAGLGLWGVAPTPVPTPKPTPQPTSAPVAPAPAPSNCHPSYVGYCLTMTGDWDCASGSGNGPNYLAVTVQVVGYDEYDLDRDGDGYGCD